MSDPGMISFSKVKMVESLKTHNITKQTLSKEETFARFWTACRCIQDCEQHLQEAQNIFRDVQHWRGEASTWPTFSTTKKKGSENDVKKLVGSCKGAKWTAFFGCFVKKWKRRGLGCGNAMEMLNPDLITSYKNVWHQCHIVHQNLRLLTSASLDLIHSKTVSLSCGLYFFGVAFTKS